MKLTLKDVRKELPFNISYNLADISIKDILNKEKYNIEIDWDVYLPTKGINLQRGFVWTLEQKRELILSIFKGIKIPNLTFILFREDFNKENRKSIYKIIDGKQRLSTMLSFCKGEFSVIWNNKEYFFDDLDLSIQGEFLYHGRLISNIGYEYPDKLISDDDKITWFELINFAGTPQDKEHLNKLKGL
jgi:hypothetical protein